MTRFLLLLSSGLATGCVCALVATGFVAIYRVTRVVNFAQGVFAVVGASSPIFPEWGTTCRITWWPASSTSVDVQ